jgi:hypothetical protein
VYVAPTNMTPRHMGVIDHDTRHRTGVIDWNLQFQRVIWRFSQFQKAKKRKFVMLAFFQFGYNFRIEQTAFIA